MKISKQPPYRIIVGDVMKKPTWESIPDKSVQCVVTSPPYWGLRDYGVSGQLGLESTPGGYVSGMVSVFRKIRRVLRDDGTVFLNLGDTYAANRSYQVPSTKGGAKHSPAQAVAGRGSSVPDGLKPKDLIGIPWRVAFALQTDGWFLRQDIIWHKPSPMPSSVTDRCVTAHEYVFLLTKSPTYFFDHFAIREPSVDGSDTRNKRSVWTIPSVSYRGAHFATFPPVLVEPCIAAGTSEYGCCSECGAPYRRLLKRERVPTRPGADTKTIGKSAMEKGNRDPLRHVTKTEAIGWALDCPCGAVRKPCTVLDPFAGSGTTGMVARRMGRASVLIELNEKYLPLIHARIKELK